MLCIVKPKIETTMAAIETVKTTCPRDCYDACGSPASLWLMNSSYGNDKVIRRRLGPPTITLHPDDAAEAGFAEGDPILLANENGRLALAVTISDTTQRGVGIVHKGRWPGASAGDANINALVSGRKSDMAESTTVHGTEVRLLHP
jgi:anaerobic selenocysteine-containing dehydrogenase